MPALQQVTWAGDKGRRHERGFRGVPLGTLSALEKGMVPSLARSMRSLAVVASLLAPGRPAWAGDLDKAGHEIRNAPARSEPSHTSNHHSHHHEHSDAADDVLGELFAPIFYYVVLSPWYVPNQVVEGDRAEGASLRTRFADYPYADGTPGLLVEAPSTITDGAALPSERPADGTAEPPPSPGNAVAAQLAAEAAFIGSPRRAGVRARVQFPLRLELDSDWSRYQEFNPGGDVDVTWWGREHVSVRFAESSAIQFRSGIGPQHWLDAKGWVYGIDFTWGFEAFPVRPWVLAFEASAGGLGKTITAGLSGRVGVMLGPVEMGAGWNQRWIGSVALGGPFIAAQFWL